MSIGKVISVYSTSAKHVRMYDRVEKENNGMSKENLGMLMKSWSLELMSHLNIEIEQIGALSDEKCVVVANHVSYVDIPLLISQGPLSFVAKAELLNWPVFSGAFRRAHIIFVKRQSQSSRRDSAEAIINALRDGNLSVGIFPSGTTDIYEKKPWRRGPFKIAKAAGVKIQPVRLTYEPLREVAYIDDDFFPMHLYRLFKKKNVKATIEFHEPVEVDDPIKDAEKWWKWSQEIHQK